MERTIELKKVDNAEDLYIWQWLLKLLEYLDVDGMSSEESGEEEIATDIFHVKRLPWRRDMGKQLALIDKQRLKDKEVYSRRGAKPGIRFRDKVITSQREPKIGMPKACYNKEWLKDQTPTCRRSLEISDKKLEWYSFA